MSQAELKTTVGRIILTCELAHSEKEKLTILE